MNNIKVMLGEAAANYTDEQINYYLQLAIAEVEEYCRRPCEGVLEFVAENIAKIKLERIKTEGLASANYGGVSEAYINGYPQEIVDILNSKRKIKVV